ncbi:MAG: hypothetical protein RI958_2555 [Actinomycetota bacterium]
MTDPQVLERLGLRIGEPIRFRRAGTRRFVIGRVAGVASDGSIKLFDSEGSARNLRPDAVEVRRPGQRGRLTWQLVNEVATTWEQLELW